MMAVLLLLLGAGLLWFISHVVRTGMVPGRGVRAKPLPTNPGRVGSRPIAGEPRPDVRTEISAWTSLDEHQLVRLLKESSS